MTKHTSSNYLQALLSNERKGVEALYKEVFPILENWVRRNSGHSHDAGDVLQDGLIVLFEKASTPEFELTGSLKNYLMSVCKFIWLRKLKKQGRESAPIESDDVVVADEKIESVLYEEERMALFKKYFKTLSEECQTVLKLFFDGTKMRQIAEEMGYKEQFARVKKYQCQKGLIEKIKGDHSYRELVL